MNKNDILKRIQEIEYDIRYNESPGIHTYHQCTYCGRMATRRGKCVLCLNDELSELKSQLNKER